MNISELAVKTLAPTMVVMLLAGCKTIPPREAITIDHIQEALAEGVETDLEAGASSTLEPLPADVAAALIAPPVVADTGETKEVEHRFDLAVRQVPVRQFFMGLVEDTPYNMVVHPTVKGDISLTLKNVTIHEVMNTVREIYGYDYKHISGGYLVLPVELQSRMFQINYLNVTRTGNSLTRVSSGQVSDTKGESGASGSSSGPTVVGGGRSSGIVSGSQVETRSETSFWSELETSLRTILGNGKGRSVVINPQSGLLIVRALPAELRRVEQFLEVTERLVQRQVILEAKILEVTLSDGFQSGINWSLLGNPSANKTIIGSQIGGGTVLDSGSSDIKGNGGNLNPGDFDPINGTAVSAFGGVFTLNVNLNDFTAFIELLETQGNVQTLSSPRIATVNNQKAVIKVGQDEFFVTDISNTTVTTTGNAIQNPNIELTPFFSGIALDVTPQINGDGGVLLHIHPTISQVEDQQKTITVSDETQTLPLALSTVRESDSVIYAENGQIVVIGGLMQTITRERIASTPFLGDLPYLGSMFRHTEQLSEKSELVILLRPRVVDGPKVWASAARQAARRFQALDRGFHYGGKVDVFGNEAE